MQPTFPQGMFRDLDETFQHLMECYATDFLVSFVDFSYYPLQSN